MKLAGLEYVVTMEFKKTILRVDQEAPTGPAEYHHEHHHTTEQDSLVVALLKLMKSNQANIVLIQLLEQASHLHEESAFKLQQHR